MLLNNFFNKYRNGDRALGSRLATMFITLNLLDRTKPNIFVETGTTRKNKFNCPDVEQRAADGCSTVLFADFCHTFSGGQVHSCDINKENIENCRIATLDYSKIVNLYIEDSIQFLNRFNDKIDFLYLDSVDSDSPNANEHQLEEIKTALPKLKNDSIVLLDDLGYKTKLSIPFLKRNNWCQILIDIPNPSHYNNLVQGIFVHEEMLYINHSLIPIEKRYKDI